MSNEHVTVLLASLEAPSALKQNMSRTEALAMMRRHEELLTPIIQSCGGKLIKTLGHSLIASFANEKQAIEGANQLNQRLHEFNAAQADPDKRITYRLCLSEGPVVQTASDIHGTPLNQVVLMEAQCDPGQIYCAESLWRAIEDIGYQADVLKDVFGEGSAEFHVYMVNPNARPKGDVFAGVSYDAPEMEPDESSLPDKEAAKELFDFSMKEKDAPTDPHLVSLQDKIDESLSLDDSWREKDIPKTVANKAPRREVDGTSDPGAKPTVTFVPKSKAKSQKRKQLLSTIMGALMVVLVLGGLGLGAVTVFKNLSKQTTTKAAKSYDKMVQNSEVLNALTDEKREENLALRKEMLNKGTTRNVVKAVPSADLVVRTTPRKAQVWLDGKLVGRKTPLRIRRLKIPSQHTLIVRKKGYEEYLKMFNANQLYIELDVKLRKRR